MREFTEKLAVVAGNAVQPGTTAAHFGKQVGDFPRFPEVKSAYNVIVDNQSHFCPPMATTTAVIPLKLLRPGESGRVIQVIGQCEFAVRLQELGLKSGAEVEMVRGGEPCIVRLGGQQLCLRANALDGVFVEVKGT